MDDIDISKLSDEDLAKLEERIHAQRHPDLITLDKPTKYWTTVDRYVYGRYVRADREHPAVVTFNAGTTIDLNDQTLQPFIENVPPVIPQLITPAGPKVAAGGGARAAHFQDRLDTQRGAVKVND